MKKKAFTLIELLVVIAIIALLLSIVMPSLQKVKQSARTVICRNNQKQLGMGYALCLEANKQRMFAYNADKIWIEHVDEQIGNTDEVRYCPETAGKAEEKLAQAETAGTFLTGSSKEPWVWQDSSEYDAGSYCFNAWLYGSVSSNTPSGMQNEIFRSMVDVRIPYQTPLFVDGNDKETYAQNTDTPGGSIDYSLGGSTGMGRFLLDRHDMRVNVCYFDGHVEIVELEKLWTLKWNKSSSPNPSVTLP